MELREFAEFHTLALERVTSFNQRPDTLMQDRTVPDQRNLLHRTAGPYIRVNRVPLPRRPRPLRSDSGPLVNWSNGQERT
jgi:hypothetical protein